MKKETISILIGFSVCCFVLWPIFLKRNDRIGSKMNAAKSSLRSYYSHALEIKNRKMVGCIPIMDGKLYMVNGRKHGKFILPKGGQDHGKEGFYSAGKEALEEVGVVGYIDKEPLFRMDSVDWYILEVKRVLPDWKERHDRIRVLLDAENALFNREVRAVTKNVIKETIKREGEKKHPRIRNSKLVLSRND